MLTCGGHIARRTKLQFGNFNCSHAPHRAEVARWRLTSKHQEETRKKISSCSPSCCGGGGLCALRGRAQRCKLREAFAIKAAAASTAASTSVGISSTNAFSSNTSRNLVVALARFCRASAIACRKRRLSAIRVRRIAFPRPDTTHEAICPGRQFSPSRQRNSL